MAFTVVGFVLTLFPQNEIQYRVIIALFFFSLILLMFFIENLAKQKLLKRELEKQRREMETSIKNREALIKTIDNQSVSLNVFMQRWGEFGYGAANQRL